MTAMAPLPPVIPGTPSNEWASNTSGILNDETGRRDTPASVVPPPGTSSERLKSSGATGPAAVGSSTGLAAPLAAPVAAAPAAATPVQEIPGAFPREWTDDPASAIGDLLSKAQEGIATATATYLPQAQQGLANAASTAVQYLPQSVKETVAPYLPEGTSVTANASQHDTEHRTSYPSTELRGAAPGEHIGGVGALPGRLGEEAVAKLPEERAGEERSNTLAGGVANAKEAVAGATAGAAATAGYVYEKASETVDQSSAAATASLPSTEKSGAEANAHSDGVGALPGAKDEAGVALLPDERYQAGHTNISATGSSAHPVAGITSLPTQEGDLAEKEHVQGVGSLPGGQNETGVALLPEERGPTKETHTLTETEKTEMSGAKAASGAAATEPPHLSVSTSTGASSAADKNESSPSPSKHKFMDKIKGLKDKLHHKDKSG